MDDVIYDGRARICEIFTAPHGLGDQFATTDVKKILEYFLGRHIEWEKLDGLIEPEATWELTEISLNPRNGLRKEPHLRLLVFEDFKTHRVLTFEVLEQDCVGIKVSIGIPYVVVECDS